MRQAGICWRTCLAVVVALFIGLFIPSVSHATLSGICGPVSAESPQVGFCSKTLSISGSLLSITLTNTSPAANGGFIVADAFNLPQGVSASFGSSTNANFDTFLEGTISTSPFGSRTDIISLGGNANNAFEGAGGNPAGGIAVGQSATLTFNLSGSVNETDIFNSELVRFKGFNNGKSDKTGVCTGGDCNPTPTPEPATMLLLGPGMAGLVWLRRKLR